MPIINQQFRTVTCDASGCDHTVTFEATQGLPNEIIEANSWLKTNRAIQTADGRVFSYCSDLCEANSIAAGNHNAPEPKTVAPVTGGAGAIAAAAAAARQKQLQEQAIKDGSATKITLG